MSNLSLVPLLSCNDVDTALPDSPPVSLNRRRLLARSAALGAVSQAGLLGSALFASSSANADTATYISKTPVAGDTYYIAGVQYQWVVNKYIRSDGNPVWYCISRKNGTTDAWQGVKIFNVSGTGQWINNEHANNLTVTYSTLRDDPVVSDWKDELRRRATEISWNLPAGTSDHVYYEIPPTDSNEEIFLGLSYLSQGVYYLKYTFRYYSVAGWTSRDIKLCSGADRTALINLMNDAKSKANAYRLAYTLGGATVAVLAGGIAAGGAITAIFSKSNIPYWVIATGAATAVVGGVAVVATSMTARYALTLAVANLVVKAQEVYSGSPV